MLIIIFEWFLSIKWAGDCKKNLEEGYAMIVIISEIAWDLRRFCVWDYEGICCRVCVWICRWVTVGSMLVCRWLMLVWCRVNAGLQMIDAGLHVANDTGITQSQFA